jgi:hypothetical protein
MSKASLWCKCDETCPIHHLPVAINQELLEALKMCVEQLRADEPDYGKEGDAIHAALLAIAKSEGREP